MKSSDKHQAFRLAHIFAIDRLRMGTDGHGITTLVSFMGCPLRCAYCLNDRCHEEIYSYGNNGLSLKKEIIQLDVNELYDRVKVDDLYFQATGGGICFGGGEPTRYASFIEEFRRICGNVWKITLETSLYCPEDTIRQLAPIVDHWIVDIKDINHVIYERYTGHPSRIRDHSLSVLLQTCRVKDITVKVPLIPGYNTDKDVDYSLDELERMGFTNFECVRYLQRESKYHPQTKGLQHERKG